MITPRRTRLLRVPDLHGFRQAIAALSANEPPSTPSRSPVIVVPTRAAATQLRSSFALTRDELYNHLHGRLATPPRRLTTIERDVIAQAAARAAAHETQLAFRLRPGLVREMLGFYDQVRRQLQHIDRFEELMSEALGSEELGSAGERMRRQTRFLADTFREYERRVRASDGCDEHLLRERLLAEPAPDPIRHIIVTVADWIAGADGLHVADFDLLSRLPGLQSLDIIATERLLRSGFHERLHCWWPGIEESPGPSQSLARGRPLLLIPPDARVDEPWWTHRDREEEIVAIARQLKADRRRGQGAPLDRTAVVFKRPLPYLYLAAEVFGSAGIPYQTSDGLPLAAEPTSAAIDLMLDTVASDFTRDALVALLHSPHFVFEHEGREVTRADATALNRALGNARYLGDLGRLEALAARMKTMSVLQAALMAARELAPLATSALASVQIERTLAFWHAHARPIADNDPFASRERRARAAIVETLTALASVHAAHDDPSWTIEEVALAVRRWIEEQTFELELEGRGVHLLDDRAARYGDFDGVTIVGVVEPDWPERPRRNIFYPPALLKSLGWPSEKDRRAAAAAHFLDLLSSASQWTSVSVFTLDEDALVSRSIQLDEIPRAHLSSMARTLNDDARVFIDEALSLEPVTDAALEADARVWAEMRRSRSPADAARFHGSAGPLPQRAWSVSALETYLACPFKFFAQHALKLEEEPEDEEVMDPKRQGRFVHEVFERFFRAWQEAGRRAITRHNLQEARALLVDIVDRTLEDWQVPDAEAGLERTRLLGSPSAAGLGEAVMRMEAERATEVVERLLEHRLTGEFWFATSDGPRTIALRGKADRLDLLDDGTFRLVDYKLGWPPDKTRALQLPIYSICAEQRLAAHRGRQWTLAEATYLAFKGPKRVVPLFKNRGERDEVLAKAQQRLIDVVDQVASGQFPPTPDDLYRCESCSFGAVCRKDYVGDV